MLDNTDKVIKKLFERPEYHFHIRELARETKLHPNTVISITDKLAKGKIIKKERRKNLVEVYCDTDSSQYKRKKQLFNISQVQQSGLLDHLINHYNHPQAIILFGSFSRGEDWSNSDIDVAIVSENRMHPNLSKFEKTFKKKIHLLTFTYKDISKEFYNNIINGFLLYGYIEDERISIIYQRKKSK